MKDELRFDGKVALVTGAGNGLGRCHALFFASRGAKVVVNDLGSSATGEGKASEAADKVVEEIRAAGGEAIANYDSVEDGAAVVQSALDSFGQIDIVVNNAGILRDVSFAKMTDQDWELIWRVHLLGAYRVTHAAWPHMREAGYGRIIMTASAAGIYGNFGQANYSMAKLGLVGFAQTLALEGRKRNIFVNAIAPVAASRMTESVLPPNLLEALKPEYVTPLVAYLCHESCEENGGLFEVGGGFVGKLRWERTQGQMFRIGRTVTPELVQQNWNKITDFKEATHPTDVMNSLQCIIDNVEAGPSKGGNELIDVDAALGYEYPPTTTSYDERDLAIYALGVGAARDPMDSKDLQLVYEMHKDGFRALPTYGVTPALDALLTSAKEGKMAPGLNYGLDRLLHGEQYTELKRPLPPRAKLTHKTRIKDIFDKGKNALVISETRSYDESGEELIVNEFTALIRGAGGWGGDRGPTLDIPPPDRKPDAVVSESIAPNQALIYRLSGDWNPLHVDPAMATAFGFPKPILHGLCTFGYAARHVIKSFCDGDTRYFKSIRTRFSDTVFPGETLETLMWKESDTRIIFNCKVKERDKVVISNSVIELYTEIPQPKAKAAKAAASAKAVSAEPNSADIFTAIGSYIKGNPETVTKVSTVYQFKLSNPDSTWTVDLKTAPGGVSEGETIKPECTLELTDQDFMDMCTGKADAQKLYFGGKLKIAGNVMASQKLTFLQKIDPASVMAAAKARAGGDDGGGEAEATPVSAEPTSADIFTAIGQYVTGNPDTIGRVATVYQFKLKDPDSVWTVDIKNAPGGVSEGETAKPECTLELTDQDFMDMCTGKADAQKLYFGGKLKIAGNVMASQKLTFLQKIDPASVMAAAKARAAGGAAGAASGAEEATSPSWEVFIAIGDYVSKHPELAEKIKMVYQFKLTDPDSVWTVDLKNGAGLVVEGDELKADCTLELAESDFMDMTSGAADPQKLYFGGKLKISGNVMASQKLTFLQKIDPDEAKAAVAAAKAAGAHKGRAAGGPAKKKESQTQFIFFKLAERVATQEGIEKEVGALIQFNITEPESHWVVDLKTGSGEVKQGENAEADAVFTISEEDLLELIGNIDLARDKFQRGALTVDGDLNVAHHLGFLKGLI